MILSDKLTNKSLLPNKAYINGKWVDASKSFDVINPSTQEVIASVPDMGAEETHDAIAAADGAFKDWAAKTAKERGAFLKKWYQLILDNREDLGIIMAAEQGKPVKEAIGEVLYGAEFVEWFAEEGKRAYGDVIPTTTHGSRVVTMKQPVGVCAMITPWNFPSAMITRKMPPALAAGCTVVSKPAEDTPLSAIALAVLAEEAGFPKGVINVVTTSHSSDVGKAMCESDIVRKLSFTGSTKVGKILMGQCADTMKKLSLELGGNAPFVVFGDADIDAAVKGLVAGKFRNCGQVCIAPNRIYVQDSVHDEFVEKLKAAVSDIKVGDGFDEDSDIGPLINQAGLEKVQDHVQDALDKGATVVLGGKQHKKGATFFEPTILTGMTDEMKVASDETFGPVASIFKFTDEQDAIDKANDTIYGLAAYFYTRDIGRVWRVSEAIEAGIIGANTGSTSSEVAPFGGVKHSGIGREGSKYGLDEFLEIKYVAMGGIEES
ncbi:MAG: NAD-dependent succinate-semialdehyde dehydrogenase [Alphaproteobacteria bacterium]|nr:NAD-dependent succinate-semialdehyde dehydrogenase [Alphaproteobacteria bacterium]